MVANDSEQLSPLTVHIAEQPENNNKNQDGRNAAAAKFPSGRSGKESA
jgi:hypothetical protein